MSDETTLSAALQALRRASDALDRLDRMCCDPGRSPRMAELRAMVDDITMATTGFGGTQEEADGTGAKLEEAGAAIGRLEIGCCAPPRLPLYATMLEELTKVRSSLDSMAGRGH